MNTTESFLNVLFVMVVVILASYYTGIKSVDLKEGLTNKSRPWLTQTFGYVRFALSALTMVSGFAAAWVYLGGIAAFILLLIFGLGYLIEYLKSLSIRTAKKAVSIVTQDDVVKTKIIFRFVIVHVLLETKRGNRYWVNLDNLLREGTIESSQLGKTNFFFDTIGVVMVD